uniref:Uncharacterized protein n=1 Tax=Archaeoglobus fulgidus TaxID=2234 RepID=A0A7J3M2I1_ARCFL
MSSELLKEEKIKKEVRQEIKKEEVFKPFIYHEKNKELPEARLLEKEEKEKAIKEGPFGVSFSFPKFIPEKAKKEEPKLEPARIGVRSPSLHAIGTRTETKGETRTEIAFKEPSICEVKEKKAIEVLEVPSIKTLKIQFQKELPKIPKIETEEERGDEEPEDVLDKLVPAFKDAISKILNYHRPLCLICIGEKPDGLKMVEDLMSTKYTYHGEYRFSKKLPWIESEIEGKRSFERIEKPYDLIISEELIVQINANENNKQEIIRGLREISKRGAKCVILYVKRKEVKAFEGIDKVPGVDFVFIELPEYNKENVERIGKLLGIDLDPNFIFASYGTIDDVWSHSVRLYEEMMDELDRELPTRDVDFFPERESSFHYLMKRIVYWFLRRKGYTNVKVEKPEALIDKEGKFVGYVIPDIIADGEYWEIETGYPASDEKMLIKEYWNPYSRLVGKISKYKGSPHKIRIVFPSIYANLFREEIKEVKKYFEERGIDLKIYAVHLSGKGELRLFM